MHGRKLSDIPATRTAIYDKSLAELKAIEPIKGPRHTLSLTDVDYIDPPEFPLSKVKESLLSGKSLGRRVHGTWVLTDHTGKEVERKSATIATVPYMSQLHGLIIHNGNGYTLANQQRLDPGVFTRVKENGEVEAHINVLPGQGRASRISLDPKSGQFKMQLGMSHVPLISVLNTMGVNDNDLVKAWGAQLTFSNKRDNDPRVLGKVYDRVVRNIPDPIDNEARSKLIREAFHKMPLDPDVTSATLGVPHKNVTKELLLDASRKVLRVSRGEDTPDDRDHLGFMRIMGPEDLIAERIRTAPHTLRRYMYRVTAKNSLDPIPSNVLTGNMHAAILSSGLGGVSESINPLQIHSQMGRVSRMGVGAIEDIDSIPDESRSVQPSHYGYIDPLFTPESLKAGVDLRAAHDVFKGDDNRLYSQFIDARTGRKIMLSPRDLIGKALGFPGTLESSKKYVYMLVDGKIRKRRKEHVDYVFPHSQNAYSPELQLIALKENMKGQRASMGGRMITQALPLVNPEAPLVRSAVPGIARPTSYEELYSDMLGAVRAEKPGHVMAVTPDGIKVKHDDGTTKLYELAVHIPNAQKTGEHNTPVVATGSRVEAGHLLAKSNYTDASGHAALGLNARVGYIPDGYNYEDAITISESLAKRLTSDHYYQHHLELVPEVTQGKQAYESLFPGTHSRDILDKLDEHGVIKPGTVVNPDEPLILAARQRATEYGIHRAHKHTYSDASVLWDHEAPGIVRDVMRTPKGILVSVQTSLPMQLSDKLSGKYGDKAVVSRIVPDDQMPHDSEGRPLEALVNPAGIITRTNPSQIYEAILGKIAAKTGKPYLLTEENGKNMWSFVKGEMAKHGISDKETLTDPRTGRAIPGVLTGTRFLMKLHHMASSKAQGRGFEGYTADEVPARGGEHGAKKIGMMELSALLSHGATDVVRDAMSVRGQSNPDHWSLFMRGFTPPPARDPLVHQKFLHMLQAAGANPVQMGRRINLMALRGADVDTLAGDREVTRADTVHWDEGLKPIEGGLFDETLTGGLNGSLWSKISLSEHLPSPVMEGPIRKILGLTEQKFIDVLSGRDDIGGLKGPDAIYSALNNLDVDKEIAHARGDIASGRKTKRNDARLRLGYLMSAKKDGIHPRDWFWHAVPVLPPKFRAVSRMMDTGLPIVPDANALYRDLFDANLNLSQMKGKVGDVSHERETLYNALKAVVGLGDPVHPKSAQKGVKGFFKQLVGSHGPKSGYVQRRLLGASTDLVGRGVVMPNPHLDIDHIGIPEETAWHVYYPFIVRRLVKRGVPASQAIEYAQNHHQMARGAMIDEMAERPVIVNRAPTLHRYGIMAFRPVLTAGHQVQVSPNVTVGFNMDFDGDTVQFHVPASDDAVKEAIAKMLPSRNLFSPSDFKASMFVPRNEFVGGLYNATTRQSDRPKRIFATEGAAIAAYKRGELGIADPVEILSHKEL